MSWVQIIWAWPYTTTRKTEAPKASYSGRKPLIKTQKAAALPSQFPKAVAASHWDVTWSTQTVEFLWPNPLTVTGVLSVSVGFVLQMSAYTGVCSVLLKQGLVGCCPERCSTFLFKDPMRLGGSWVVISGLISPLIWVIIVVALLITPLITTHEPPSTCSDFQVIVPFCTAAICSDNPHGSPGFLVHVVQQNLRDPRPKKDIIMGFRWDIRILSFSYVLFWDPSILISRTPSKVRVLSPHTTLIIESRYIIFQNLIEITRGPILHPQWQDPKTEVSRSWLGVWVTGSRVRALGPRAYGFGIKGFGHKGCGV